jgi:hypothetical protein
MKKVPTLPRETVIINGQPGQLAQQPRQRGMDDVSAVRVSQEVLLKLDHVEWLENFAKVMRMQTGVEMTPMRQGVISRVNLAAEYIRYLKVQNELLVDKCAKLLARAAPAEAGEAAVQRDGNSRAPAPGHAQDDPDQRADAAVGQAGDAERQGS